MLGVSGWREVRIGLRGCLHLCAETTVTPLRVTPVPQQLPGEPKCPLPSPWDAHRLFL